MDILKDARPAKYVSPGTLILWVPPKCSILLDTAGVSKKWRVSIPDRFKSEGWTTFGRAFDDKADFASAPTENKRGQRAAMSSAMAKWLCGDFLLRWWRCKGCHIPELAALVEDFKGTRHGA